MLNTIPALQSRLPVHNTPDVPGLYMLSNLNPNYNLEVRSSGDANNKQCGIKAFGPSSLECLTIKFLWTVKCW